MGPRPPENEDGVVVRGVHLRQLAAAIQPSKRLALEKLLLSRVLLVVCVVRRPSADGRRELHRDARLVEHVERVSDLGEKETRPAIVRADHGCVGHDEKNVLVIVFSSSIKW